jgi:two-component system sensor histidine kinase BaeS
MRLGITAKLFLVIVTTSIVVAIAMGAAGRINFKSDFRHYVGERHAQHFTRFGKELEEAYRKHGNWDFLRGNAPLLLQLLQTAASGDLMSPDFDLPPASSHEHRPGLKHFSASPPFSVLDAERKVIVGLAPLEEKAPIYPIVVNQRTVGWLVGPIPGKMPDDTDRHFQERQFKATWSIGAFSIVFAALVAVLLARVFLAPMRRLAHATHRLAAGDYTTRVKVTSGDELGRLGEDFNRLAVTLEKNEQLRGNLVADISHELRTPLSVLRAELEALQDGIRSLTPDSLKSLQAEVSMLSKLVDDLYELSLADVGALAYRMTEVDIGGLIHAVAGAFQERLTAKDLSLELDIADNAPPVRGDPQRLRQLLNNLLENSLRYTNRGGTVRIAVACHGANELRIDLQDSAPGVPEELLPRLFERLFRVDTSRNRETGGAGLGLAICQRIVEAHEGRIVAKPSALGGVWIELTLQLSQPT